MITLDDYWEAAPLVKTLQDALDIPPALLYFDHHLHSRALTWPGGKILLDHKQIEIQDQTRENFMPTPNNIQGFLGRLNHLGWTPKPLPEPNSSWRLDTLHEGHAVNFRWRKPSATSETRLSRLLQHNARMYMQLKVFYHPTHKAFTFNTISSLISKDTRLNTNFLTPSHQFFQNADQACAAAEKVALEKPALPAAQGYLCYLDIMFTKEYVILFRFSGISDIREFTTTPPLK